MTKLTYGAIAIAVVFMASMTGQASEYRILSDGEITSLWGSGICLCENHCASDGSCSSAKCGTVGQNCGYVNPSGSAYFCIKTGQQACEGTASCEKKQCNCAGGPAIWECLEDEDTSTVEGHDCV